MSMEIPLPPRVTRPPHHGISMTHAYPPLSHLNKPALFTPTRTQATAPSPYQKLANVSLLPRTGSSSSLHSLSRSPASFLKARPSPVPSPFPSPVLGSSLSSLTTSALINAHLSSSASSLSLSSLSSLTHSPVQSGSSSGTIINILSKLNSTDVDECALDEVDAHAYTEVSSHSSSSSSSNNSTNGEMEDEDVSHMYDYGGDGSHTSGHMENMDSSVLSVSTSSSMMSSMASSSLSYMSFGGSSHYVPQHHEMNEEYPEAAKDIPVSHTHMSMNMNTHAQPTTQTATTTEDNLELEAQPVQPTKPVKTYNTRSRRASSDHIASPYLSPLLLAVMNNESALPTLSFASPALSPTLGGYHGQRTMMATTQHAHVPYHGAHASNAAHLPLSPMSNAATSGMTSMPALSPLASPQTSPLMGARALGNMSLASLSTMHAAWPHASPASSPAPSAPSHSYMVPSFHPPQHYYPQQALHFPTMPQYNMTTYQPGYYGHEQVSVKLEPRIPIHEEVHIPPRPIPSAITQAAATAHPVMPIPPAPAQSQGTKRKLEEEPRRVKKTIPKKSVKRRKKTGNESPSSDEQEDELQATLSGDYKYQCTYEDCGDCFKTRFSLKRHLKKHTGEKPYVCGIDGCDKTFAEKSTLKRHLRIHTGEKPYQCHVPGCGKLFADRTNVKRHEMIHTGERPYWCPFASCSRGYFWRKHLRKHVSSVHHANLSALASYAKKNKQGVIIVGSGIVATAQTVPQSREAHGKVEEEDDIVDDPDHEEPDDEEDDMNGDVIPSPRAKSKRVSNKKIRQ